MIKKIKDWGELTLKEKKKYGGKNQYYFKTDQNVFGVTDNVFNKCRKLVELVEGLGGVSLEAVTGDYDKKNTMFLEFSDTDLLIQVYVNSSYITVGNHPYTGYPYFDMGLKVGSSHVDEVVDFIKKCFTK